MCLSLLKNKHESAHKSFSPNEPTNTIISKTHSYAKNIIIECRINVALIHIPAGILFHLTSTKV